MYTLFVSQMVLICRLIFKTLACASSPPRAVQGVDNEGHCRVRQLAARLRGALRDRVDRHPCWYVQHNHVPGDRRGALRLRPPACVANCREILPAVPPPIIT